MALMEWNPKLSVKVQHFDEQHKMLVDYVNELHNAMVTGKGNEVLGIVLDKLVDYTSNHFKEEEQMMEQYGYPETDIHKSEHEQLVKQVLDLQQQFTSGQNIMTLTVMMFLKSWLMHHIQIVDKKYGTFFNNHGIE